MCLLAGASLAQAAYLANLAAGIEVTRLGAVPVSAADLLKEVERRDPRVEPRST
jgi:bifunctional ADP-heptose synthase (sugar kinase/adenylyltransferase)